MKIIDNGRGVSDKEKENLFTHKYLGLHTSKSLIEQMGGSLIFETKHGHGTAFFLNFSTIGKKANIKVGKDLHYLCTQIQIDHPQAPKFLTQMHNSHVFSAKEPADHTINTSLILQVEKP